MSDSALHALARRIEGANASALASHSETAARLFPELGATAISVAGGLACFVGKESPISYAVGLGLHGSVTADDVRQVVEFYESRGVVPRVDVCALADPSLLAALREHDFQLHWFVNVLTRRLELWDIIAPPPDGIAIRQAETHEAELWTRVVDEGFSDGAPLTETRRQLGLMLFHRPTMRCYFARVAGEIAGAGALFVHEGYAALVATSVRVPFRRRGVHAALIRARLQVAQDLNCDAAGFFAEPGSISQRNAERHLFRLAYVKAVMKRA